MKDVKLIFAVFTLATSKRTESIAAQGAGKEALRRSELLGLCGTVEEKRHVDLVGLLFFQLFSFAWLVFVWVFFCFVWVLLLFVFAS